MRKINSTLDQKRFQLATDKNNSILVEEINHSELENIWKKLNNINQIF
jgi:hypothetical protein